MDIQKQNIKVSVIIPFYNAYSYLERCLHSLFGQTLQDMEFIFVDDCSTDGGHELIKFILKKYPERVDSVKIVNHEIRKGVACARNTGLKEVSGAYIGWCDADDWARKDMFEDLYREITDKQADLVWCDYSMDFEHEQIINKQEVEEDPKMYSRALVQGNIQGMLWNKLVRTSIFKDNQIQFLNHCDMGEDRNVLIKLLCKCHNIIHLPGVYYHYVQDNTKSITKDFDPKRTYEEIDNTADIEVYIKNNNIDWIPQSDIDLFKFRTKFRLLFSTSVQDFRLWSSIFREVNKLVYAYPMRFRHRVLAISAMYRMWLPIYIWVFFKQKGK